MSSSKYLLLLIVLTVLLVGRFYHFYRTLPVYHDGEQVRFTATLTQEPKLVSGKQRFSIKTPDGVRVSILMQSSPFLQYGDRVFIDGIFTQKEFESHKYWMMYFPKVQMAKSDQNIVTSSAYHIRNEAKKISEQALPPTSASLLLGIVFGGNRGMSDDFSQKLRTVGVLHVVAASGMNVSFVAGALLYTLGTFLRRRIALGAAIFGIVFYVFLAGFEPSIIRAATMSTIAFSASLLGRQNAALTALGLTGYGMLFFSPGLWEDVGFQLSFMATLGILEIKPVMDKLVERLGKWGKLSGLEQDVTTTLAAQVTTVPILLGTFGSYGLLSILVNALVLWTVPILMVLGALAVISGMIFLPLGILLLYVSYPFLWYFEQVVSFFGGVGWMIEVGELPLILMVGYYLMVVAGVMFVKGKAKNAKRKNTT